MEKDNKIVQEILNFMDEERRTGRNTEFLHLAAFLVKNYNQSYNEFTKEIAYSLVDDFFRIHGYN